MRRKANSLRFGLLGWVVSCDGAPKCVNAHGRGVRVCTVYMSACVCATMRALTCVNVRAYMFVHVC